MACRERQLADAVVTAINAGTYSRKVNAKRAWSTNWHLDELSSLHCGVMPGLHLGGVQNRAKFLWEYPVVVGFSQQVDKHIERDSVDGIVDVVEEVVDDVKLSQLTLENGVCASQFAVEYLRHADTEYLTEKGMFLSLVQFTYRVVA